MTEAAENKQVVVQWFQALSRNDFDAAAALMEPTGEYWVLRDRKVMPIADFPGVIAGHATTTFADGVRFDVGELTAEDDRVSARVEGHAVMRKDGSVYANSYHYLFTVHDGLIDGVWEYGDTLMAFRAFGGVQP